MKWNKAMAAAFVFPSTSSGWLYKTFFINWAGYVSRKKLYHWRYSRLLWGLQRLLDKVSFNPEQDTLHGVGDLVARGEDSLSTLRFLRSLGPRFHSVLGNHDLHLLAVANGIKKPKKDDKLAPLLAAPDLPELLDWLRQFLLLHKWVSSIPLCMRGFIQLGRQKSYWC